VAISFLHLGHFTIRIGYSVIPLIYTSYAVNHPSSYIVEVTL